MLKSDLHDVEHLMRERVYGWMPQLLLLLQLEQGRFADEAVANTEAPAELLMMATTLYQRHFQPHAAREARVQVSVRNVSCGLDFWAVRPSRQVQNQPITLQTQYEAGTPKFHDKVRKKVSHR